MHYFTDFLLHFGGLPIHQKEVSSSSLIRKLYCLNLTYYQHNNICLDLIPSISLACLDRSCFLTIHNPFPSDYHHSSCRLQRLFSCFKFKELARCCQKLEVSVFSQNLLRHKDMIFSCCFELWSITSQNLKFPEWNVCSVNQSFSGSVWSLQFQSAKGRAEGSWEEKPLPKGHQSHSIGE